MGVFLDSRQIAGFMDSLIGARCGRKPIIVARTMFPGSEVTAREREERKEGTNGADIKDAATPLVKLPCYRYASMGAKSIR